MEIILWTVEQTVRSRTNRELTGRTLDSKHRGPASVLNISLLDEDQKYYSLRRLSEYTYITSRLSPLERTRCQIRFSGQRSKCQHARRVSIFSRRLACDAVYKLPKNTKIIKYFYNEYETKL